MWRCDPICMKNHHAGCIGLRGDSYLHARSGELATQTSIVVSCLRERRVLDQRHGRDRETGWLWGAGEDAVIDWMERERRAASRSAEAFGLNIGPMPSVGTGIYAGKHTHWARPESVRKITPLPHTEEIKPQKVLGENRMKDTLLIQWLTSALLEIEQFLAGDTGSGTKYKGWWRDEAEKESKLRSFQKVSGSMQGGNVKFLLPRSTPQWRSILSGTANKGLFSFLNNAPSHISACPVAGKALWLALSPFPYFPAGLCQLLSIREVY